MVIEVHNKLADAHFKHHMLALNLNSSNDDDVRTMFSVFDQHSTRGPMSWTLRWLDLLNKF